MTATITIDPGGANEVVIPPSNVERTDPVKTHTGVGDFTAEVTYDTALADRNGDAVHITDAATEYFFRGYLRRVMDSERAGSAMTRLQGRGVAHDLSRGANEHRVKNTLIHDAIDDYWANHTGFSATVTNQTAENTTTGTSVQEANTDAEFNAITNNLGATDPFLVQNTNLEGAQTGFFERGSFDLQDSNGETFTTPSGHSDSGCSRIKDLGDWIEYDFTTEYEIPPTDPPTAGLRWGFRYSLEDGDNSPGLDVTIRESSNKPGLSNTLDPTGVFEDAGNWSTVASGDFSWDTGQNTAYPTLDANTTYTVRIEVIEETSGTGSPHYIDVDAVWVGDNRFGPYDFDNTVVTDGDPLDGPQEFAASAVFTFDLAASTWNITDGSLTTSWNNTTDDESNQRIQVRLNDQTWFPSDGTEDDASSVTTDFGSEVGISIQGRARFGRLTDDTTTSPATGDKRQVLQSWEISIDGNDIPVYNDTILEGSDLSILQQLHADARMRFTVAHAADSKTVESYPVGTTKPTPEWTVVGENRVNDIGARYANDVTIRGAKDADGNRIKKNLDSQAAVSDVGREHWEEHRPDATTQVEVDRIARQVLKRHLREADVTAEREIVSQEVAPGWSYDITLQDGTTATVASEEVQYRIADGDVVGRVRFDVRATELQERVNSVGSGLIRTQLSF